jgi:hypothetical protein
MRRILKSLADFPLWDCKLAALALQFKRRSWRQALWADRIKSIHTGVCNGMLKTSAIWLVTLVVATAGNLAEKPHPRLWFPKSAEAPLRARMEKDPLLAQSQAAVMAEAGRILEKRTCRYEIPDGKRLLFESRLALHNVTYSAWAWRLSGEEKFRLRTIAELDAACALKDWNPSHFLDTAEMATAVATGYDWLHPTLTTQQRTNYEQAIIEKALRPAKAGYDNNSHWTRPRNNWGQVCGAGIAIAAAAVAEVEPGLAEPLFEKGWQLVKACGKFYQPDGMYPEGPGYWHYGTNYHVLFLAAAAGLDRPVDTDPILKKAGDAIMHLTSPIRLNYNFADGSASMETPSLAQSWLAAEFNDAPQARHIRRLLGLSLEKSKKGFRSDRFFPLALLSLPAEPAPEAQPHAAVFGGEQAVALFRSGWKNDSAFLGIKGGTAAASHGHMDVGSFVYDAHGLRWLHDLGSENYNLPGYFGSKRWEYYRLQNRSHNTLEINGQLQNSKAKPCGITHAQLVGDKLEALLDISDAYAGSAAKLTRRATFHPATGMARIDDEVTDPSGVIVWRAFTDATPEIQGDSLILRKSGRQITLVKISNAGEWTVEAATPPTAEESQNEKFKALTLTVPEAAKVSISVEIRP